MRILFLFVALIMITSCDKNDLVTMVYQETQCSDVWQDGSTSTEEAVINYFESQHDIKLDEVTIRTVNTGATCLACNCSSGREIEIYINESEITIVESEGFVRK
ncbi:MAG: hypothetical protein AB8G11_09440 [Saprospiraceae bacterium]